MLSDGCGPSHRLWVAGCAILAHHPCGSHPDLSLGNSRRTPQTNITYYSHACRGELNL